MRAYWALARVFNARYRLRLLALAALVVAAAPCHAGAPMKLLAIGDSLTAGYGLPPDESFAAKLQAALTKAGMAVTVINGGVSGATSAGGLATLDWQLADQPDAALVELGANDMLRGIDPAETRKNLAAILRRLKDRHIPTLLCGMKSANNWGPDYAGKFDAIYPDLARQDGVPLYPFFLDGVALDPKLTQPDGLHPNAAGVDVIVDHIMPSVVKLLQPAG
jgi:acyl-CoA thioesterase-1